LKPGSSGKAGVNQASSRSFSSQMTL